MAEYIEREAVLQKKTRMTEYDEGGWGANVSVVRIEDINAIPAADVVEVVHGRWEWYKSPVCLSGDLYYRCSICGESDPWQMTTRGHANYCPNCGAKMEVNDG